MKNLLNYLLVFSLLTLASCEKIIPEPEPEPTPTTYANPTPTFAGSDGFLAAVQSLTYQSTAVGDFSIPIDVATGAFFNTSTTFFDAGSLNVNSNALEIQDNNSYVSISASSTSIDLDFGSSGNEWVIGGSSDIPAFSHTTSRGMPSDIKFTSENETINTANSLTISIVSAPSTCDSILYLLAAENSTVTKTVSSSTTSVTFTSAEMSGLSGSGVSQVAAYNFESSTESGKEIYYINEKVISDVVTFE